MTTPIRYIGGPHDGYQTKVQGEPPLIVLVRLPNDGRPATYERIGNKQIGYAYVHEPYLSWAREQGSDKETGEQAA